MIKEFKIHCIILVLCLIINIPFWVFGENSSIGGYDDIHFGVPSLYFNMENFKNVNFFKEYACGISLQLFPNSNSLNFHRLLSLFSSKEVLFYYCMTFRLLAYYFGLLSWFIYCNKILKKNRLSLLVAFAVVISIPKSYDWMFCSWGPLLLVLPLLTIVFRDEIKSYKKIIFASVILIYASVSSIYLYWMIFLLLILLNYRTIKNININKKHILFFAILLTIYLSQIYDLFVAIKNNPNSSRLMKFDNLANYYNGNFNIHLLFDNITNYLTSNIYIFIFLFFIFPLVYFKNSFKTLLFKIFLIILIYFLTSCIVASNSFKYLSGYRYEVILYAINLVILFQLPLIFSKIRTSAFNNIYLSIVLLFYSFGVLTINLNAKLTRIKTEGGFNTFSDYSMLDELNKKMSSSKFRVCSNPWKPRPSLLFFTN